MKSSLFIVVCFFLALVGFAQSSSKFYFDIAAKGGHGLTLLMNKNIFNDKHIVSEISFGSTFGGRLGGNFNENHSVNVEVLSSTFRQRYNLKTDSLSWNKTISFTTLDVAFLYRHFVEGTYIEVGPEFAFIKRAGEENSISGNTDITKNFVPNYMAGVLGFGANLIGSDNINVMLGFRASYSLTDIISDAGGKSNNRSYPLNDNFYKTTYTSYSSTNPLTLRILLEISFDLGYFTNSNCNKNRTRFVTF